MNFETRHAINPKNESFRRKNGFYTYSHLLNGASIGLLKPSPLPCGCGHFPEIKVSTTSHECSINCKGCSVEFSFKGSYAGAILEWNKLDSVPFDFSQNKLNPFVNFDGDVEYFTEQVEAVKPNILALKAKASRSERKLSNLMGYWCDFSIYKAKQIESAA